MYQRKAQLHVDFFGVLLYLYPKQMTNYFDTLYKYFHGPSLSLSKAQSIAVK